MPTARWSLVPRMAASMVAVMSPSAITLMRAPASRISAIRSSWRGRSSTTAVMSPTLRPNASAIPCRFSVTLFRRSTWPLATGPTAIFFMYMRGTRVIPPGSQAARIESAPTPPRATTRRSLDRVAGQLQRRAAAAHGRARRQRVALLAAADHDRAADRQRVDRLHQRLAGRLVGAAGIAAAEVAAGRQRAALADRGQVGAGAALVGQAALRGAACCGLVCSVAMPAQGTAPGAAVARSRIRSSTARSAASPSEASTTGTPTRSARATR